MRKNDIKYPKELGYIMPPEWYPHYGTWLSYPHNPLTFFERMDSVRDAYAEIIYHISQDEYVHINVNDKDMEQDLIERLKAKKVDFRKIFIHHYPTNDAWCRDHGAIFVLNRKTNKIAGTCWKFNSWGGKYPHDLDEKIPELMTDFLKVETFKIDMVLEGGSIDVNGNGVLLTTEQCLLNPNRNPHLSKEEIENHLKLYLGVDKILWLKEGIVGDDTDGHIDDIARFVSSDTIVTVIEDNTKDENYDILKENLQKLKSFTDLNGNFFKIITLPMPEPQYYRNERVPASYANFYITNNSVLVPTFKSKNDERALEILKKVFKNKKVIGIDCSDIIIGLGSIHCLTQQIPAFNLK
ncbi:MAG: agmatine deiminase family protein [Proteobacteria bacterium]|nr:agmatine deiminase family protein [Pseudomonadota bacterium]